MAVNARSRYQRGVWLVTRPGTGGLPPRTVAGRAVKGLRTSKHGPAELRFSGTTPRGCGGVIRTAGEGCRASDTLDALPERTAGRVSASGLEVIRAARTGPTCLGELKAMPRGLGANCGVEWIPWRVAGSVLRVTAPRGGDVRRMAPVGGLTLRTSSRRDGPRGMALAEFRRESGSESFGRKRAGSVPAVESTIGALASRTTSGRGGTPSTGEHRTVTGPLCSRITACASGPLCSRMTSSRMTAERQLRGDSGEAAAIG